MEDRNMKIKLKDRITITVNKNELEVIRIGLNEARNLGKTTEDKREIANKVYNKIKKTWNSLVTNDSDRV